MMQFSSRHSSTLWIMLNYNYNPNYNSDKTNENETKLNRFYSKSYVNFIILVPTCKITIVASNDSTLFSKLTLMSWMISFTDFNSQSLLKHDCEISEPRLIIL